MCNVILERLKSRWRCSTPLLHFAGSSPPPFNKPSASGEHGPNPPKHRREPEAGRTVAVVALESGTHHSLAEALQFIPWTLGRKPLARPQLRLTRIRPPRSHVTEKEKKEKEKEKKMREMVTNKSSSGPTTG